MTGLLAAFVLLAVLVAAGAGAWIWKASSDAARRDASPFGVLDFLAWDHDWNGGHYGGGKALRAVQKMKEAGIDWIRIDILWSDVEPVQGRWDFTKYDRLVDLLHGNGIRVLAMLHYNAAWAGEWNTPPDPEAFTRYAATVVNRYRGRIRHWEIWNEPNMDIYWKPQDGMRGYAALMQKVYPAIKREDPRARVLIGGLTMVPEKSLEDFYRNGGAGTFDIANLHPFVDPLDRNAIQVLKGKVDRFRAVLDKHGDGAKPIWITEIGCPGVPDPAASPAWWMGRNPLEAEQAEWVTRLYGEPLGWPGVEKIFWAFFRDTPDHFHVGTDFFGLVRSDFSEKPSFAAYRDAVRRHRR